MKFNRLKTKSGVDINGPLLISPEIISDSRGFFYESWNKRNFDELIGEEITFVQDNHSKSQKGILRGLHYQIPNIAQSKLVRCTIGTVFDVAVDIRKSSPTFKEYVSVLLDDKNKAMFWIPEGFAHGFLALSEFAEVQYKTTDYWSKKHERIINWRDPSIDINWPNLTDSNSNFFLSERDLNAPLLKDLNLEEDFFL